MLFGALGGKVSMIARQTSRARTHPLQRARDANPLGYNIRVLLLYETLQQGR
jgi:hypothetical protein